MLPISLPIESGACRWQQRSSSATGFPESVLKKTTGSSRMTRRLSERVISWSQAATYQALRTNITFPPVHLVAYQRQGGSEAGDIQPEQQIRGLVRQEQQDSRGDKAAAQP